MKKLLFVILLLVACKSETKETSSNVSAEPETVELKKELIVEINFKTNRIDEFILTLNNIKIDEFQRKNISVIEKVAPSSSTETILAKFGEDNMSNAFTLLLGSNETKSVDFELISFSYGENNLVIGSSELHEYFRTNQFVALDSITGKIQTKKVNGKHNPALFLKGKAIEILIKQN